MVDRPHCPPSRPSAILRRPSNSTSFAPCPTRQLARPPRRLQNAMTGPTGRGEPPGTCGLAGSRLSVGCSSEISALGVGVVADVSALDVRLGCGTARRTVVAMALHVGRANVVVRGRRCGCWRSVGACAHSCIDCHDTVAISSPVTSKPAVAATAHRHAAPSWTSPSEH